MNSGSRAAAAAALLMVSLAPPEARAKTLHWRSLEVQASLDADGRLRVAERQNIVFDGDWNGGERIFRLEPGQSLASLKLTRIDPATGEDTPLSPGDLSAVDRYRWIEGNRLRWRSRLPSDPPFDNREIDYRLEYTLSGVIERTRGGYRLDHDFAFSDRSGPIDSFTLDLALDPVWKPAEALPGRWEAGPLPPGHGFIVRASLAFAGSSPPSAIRKIPHSVSRGLAALAVAAGLLLFAAVYWSGEKSRGRFEPLPPPARIDREWLSENVFALRPEEVGAAWDDAIGAPEVAAVLARLVAEGKLRSEMIPGAGRKQSLRLTLAAPRAAFAGYESKLIDGLFFDGRLSVTPEELRKRYAGSGFNPAGLIQPELGAKLESEPGFADHVPAPPKWRSAALFFLALGLGTAAVLGSGRLDARVAFAAGAASVFLVGAGAGLAAKSRETFRPASGWLIAAVALALAPWLGALAYFPPAASDRTLWALTALALAGLSSMFHLAVSRDGPARLRRRRMLAAARNFFRRELAEPRPRLQDAWFPYLVALGLAPQVDRWFRSFGKPGAELSSGSGLDAASASSSAGGGWTGGGGRFGGGGASASWASAVGGFASGVATPSSSSSGGGGGGGSSSGGGGGGGW
jgi:hypothetical protein